MIKIKNINKTFYNNKTKIQVLKNITFNIRKGEFISLLGPNGCGKTTFLYILAGILKQDSGKIFLDNKSIGFVSQDFSTTLLPWKNVLQNVAFGLEIKGVKKENRLKIAEDYVKGTILYKFKNFYPSQLSGGLKQLASIIRAFIYNPDILILDEPFNSLDYSLKREMELMLLKLWKKNKKTIIFVSHEIDEAIFLSDRIIVLSKRPTKIKSIINVNLARPRKYEIMVSDKFLNIKKQILKLFNLE